MNTKQWLAASSIVLITTVMAFITGCNPGAPPADRTSASAPASDTASANPTRQSGPVDHSDAGHTGEGEHGHKDGQHGGIIVSLGRDSYHIEAVVADGMIRLFTLGKDESRVIDVELQTLRGFVKSDGDAAAQELLFEPSPQTGDSANRTSLFVGKLPEALIGRSLEVTIPNIRIEGERFRLGFRTATESHGDAQSMPGKVADQAEQDLYLTPGGHYTEADIVANGKMTASQKFKGIKSSHDMNPQVGDVICPISRTKANPKFTWVIGGKAYQFCCPPCLDEFLTKAKSSSDPLPDPSSFIKQ